MLLSSGTLYRFPDSINKTFILSHSMPCFSVLSVSLPFLGIVPSLRRWAQRESRWKYCLCLHATHILKPTLAAKEWMIDKINIRSIPVRPWTVVNKNLLWFHIVHAAYINWSRSRGWKKFMLKTKLRKSHSWFWTIISNKARNKTCKDSWTLSRQITKVQNMSNHMNNG